MTDDTELLATDLVDELETELPADESELDGDDELDPEEAEDAEEAEPLETEDEDA